MSSFKTTKRKIDKIRQQNIKNDLNVSNVENNNSTFQDHIKKINKNKSFIKINKKLDATWEDMYLGDPDQSGVTDPQYKSWEYTLPQFDIRHLPYVTVEFVLKDKIVNNIEQTLMPFEFARKGVYFVTEDIEFPEETAEEIKDRIKKVTIIISLDVRSVIYYLPDFDENDFDGIENVFEIYPVVVVPNLNFFL